MILRLVSQAEFQLGSVAGDREPGHSGEVPGSRRFGSAAFLGTTTVREGRQNRYPTHDDLPIPPVRGGVGEAARA